MKAQAFSQSTVVTGLTKPVAFVITPDNRFFVTLKGNDATTSNCDSSKILVFDATGKRVSTLFSMNGDSNLCYGETGIIGVCLDVDFLTNHYVYFYYTHAYMGDTSIRVMRLTEQNNAVTNATLILKIPNSYTVQQHVGGNLRTSSLHPGKLFLSIGDHRNSNAAQDLSNPFGKILRINTDGSIPADNPFYDDGNPATGNDDRIYSYGHRNPFDFCISSLNGKIYSTENGNNTWDELNLIEAGKNYGWPTCEGAYLQATSTPCNNSAYTDPLEGWGSPLPSVTGVEFYTGAAIPSLTNHLLVGVNNYGALFDVQLGNPPFYNTFVSRSSLGFLTNDGGLTTVMQHSDGNIYVMKGGFTDDGQIYKLSSPGIGIIENTLTKTELFPNPCNEIVNIKSGAVFNFCLMDIEGRILYAKNNCVKEFELNTAELSRGLYFIKISDLNGNSTTKKLVRE
jgi:glucose/arabinose dehydrogenase